MQNKGDLKLKILDNIYKYHIKIHGTVSEFTKKKLTLGRIYCKIGQTTQNQKGVHLKLVKIGLLERCDGYVQCSAICRQMKCIFVRHLMCSANVLYCINEVEI